LLINKNTLRALAVTAAAMVIFTLVRPASPKDLHIPNFHSFCFHVLEQTDGSVFSFLLT